ncbi:MAG: family transporter substrate-binding protein [Proteobacteria bacterium]|nr:family transporter substrate-binding protein [Pseudomonadota bacterium]
MTFFRSFVRLATLAATTAALSTGAMAAEPLKAGFLYIGPTGDHGWTYSHDVGRKAVEAKFGDQVKTTFVENVPETADAERVIQRQQGDFRDILRLHERDGEGLQAIPENGVHARHRLQDRQESGHLRRTHL